MGYRQYAPHPQLSSYIDAYWTVHAEETALPVTDRILPDGCVDIIINQGAAVPVLPGGMVLAPGSTYLVGTMTRFSMPVRLPGTRLLGIRFKPAAFAAFYNISLLAATDRILPFDPALHPDKDAFSGPDFLQVLDQCLLQKISGVKHILFPVIADIYGCKGQVNVNALARRHFTSNRQLERQFKQYTGISPKAFANQVRFFYALERIRTADTHSSLLQLAIETGYYDHAHLANACRRYTGLSPSQL